MSDHLWLAEAKLERIKLYFPRSPGMSRVKDRVVSGIIRAIRNGLRWLDAPKIYERGEREMRKILKPVISGNHSAASGETKVKTAACTSPLIKRSTAFV